MDEQAFLQSRETRLHKLHLCCGKKQTNKQTQKQTSGQMIERKAWCALARLATTSSPDFVRADFWTWAFYVATQTSQQPSCKLNLESEVEVLQLGRHRKLRVSSRGASDLWQLACAVDNSAQTPCRDQVGMRTSVRSACGCYQTNKPAVSPWEALCCTIRLLPQTNRLRKGWWQTRHLLFKASTFMFLDWW